MTPSWKQISVGLFALLVALDVYDQQQISTLEAQIKADRTTLANFSRRAATPISIPQLPQAEPSNYAPDLPDRASILETIRQPVDAMTARERLWDRTYKRPAMCDNPPDDAAFITCGNSYATAHKAFIDSHPLTEFRRNTTP
jgi:hypothetical protein